MSACTAHSSTTGNPCKNPSILGGSVCRYHGGGAPQVRAKAMERLQHAIDPAITRLLALMETADQDSVSLRAALDILDRTGFKPTDKIKLSGDGDEPLSIVISRPPLPLATPGQPQPS